jgi:hypothetical protein
VLALRPNPALPAGRGAERLVLRLGGKRAEYLCVDCSRANLRAIEGRLSYEYWE